MAAVPELPPLRAVDIQEVVKYDLPVTKIRTDEDVGYWKTTRGYQDFGLFLRRLNESVVGYNLPYAEPVGDGGGRLLLGAGRHTDSLG